MLDFTPTWEFQDEPNEDQIRRMLEEAKEILIEELQLPVVADNSTELADLSQHKEIIRASQEVAKAIAFFQGFLPDKWSTLVADVLWQKWFLSATSKSTIPPNK